MIRIWVDACQPPTGRVAAAEGGPARPFVGWLQLLAILAQALQRDGTGGDDPALRPSGGATAEGPAGT